MINIQIFSHNEDFKNDLVSQIERFIDGAKVNTAAPDIVVIDDDKTLYLQKKKEHNSVPVLLLTSDSQLKGDDFNLIIHKPLNLMSFLDVIRSANNKLDNSEAGILTFNDYELHPNQKEIVDLSNKKTIKLTEKEVSIIKYLYKNKGKFASKTDLQTNVWKYNEDVTTHTVETHIYRLRQKIECDSRRLISTDNGRYKLNMD